MYTMFSITYFIIQGVIVAKNETDYYLNKTGKLLFQQLFETIWFKRDTFYDSHETTSDLGRQIFHRMLKI